MADESAFENPFRTPSSGRSGDGAAPRVVGEPLDWNPIDALTFAWEAVVAYPSIVLAAVLSMAVQIVLPTLFGLVSSLVAASAGRDGQSVAVAISAVVSLLNLPLVVWMTLGLARMSLDLARGQRPPLARLFGGVGFLNALLALLMVVFGSVFALLVIGVVLLGPGFVGLRLTDGGAIGWMVLIPGALILFLLTAYVSLRMSWLWMALADEPSGSPMDVLRATYRRSSGQVLSLFIYSILVMLVSIAALFLGMCPGLFIGMLVTVPAAQAMVQLGHAYGYLRRGGERPTAPARS